MVEGTLLFAGVNDVIGMDQKPQRLERTLVIQFDTVDELREAIESNQCNFAWAWARSSTPPKGAKGND